MSDYQRTNDWFSAVSSGNIELVSKMIEEGFDVATRDDIGDVGLLVACEKGYFDMVVLLVEEGKKLQNQKKPYIDSMNDSGWSGLMFAVDNGHKKIVEFLLDEGADVSSETIKMKWTAFLIAAWYGRSEIIKIFFDRTSSPLSDERNLEALSYACKKGHIETARMLVAEGMDVNRKSYFIHGEEGVTPFIYAMKYGYGKVADFLLENGADPHIVDDTSKKQNAFMHACDSGFGGMAETAFHSMRLKKNEIGRHLQYACKCGLTNVARVLLKDSRFDVSKNNGLHGGMAFLQACEQGYAETAIVLLQAGINVYRTNKEKQSGLFLYCLNWYSRDKWMNDKSVELLFSNFIERIGKEMDEYLVKDDNFSSLLKMNKDIRSLWEKCSIKYIERNRLKDNMAQQLKNKKNNADAFIR